MGLLPMHRQPFRRSQILLRLLAVLVAGTGIGATAAQGTSWRVEGGLMPQDAVERLMERYPDIRGPSDLESLLVDLGRRRQVLSLEAHLEGGIWSIRGIPAQVIADIDVGLVARSLRQPLLALIQNYIGQVDSAEARTRIIAVATRFMRRRGYPGASVQLAAEPVDRGMSYALRISEGDPCVISKVELGFKLPRGVSFDVAPGDLCDVETIEQAASDVETELRSRGYNQVRVEVSDLKYHPKEETATVYLAGVLGQKVRYEIVDSSHLFLIDDLFGDEDLTKVDPTIVGPDAMGAELARRYRNRGFLDVAIRGPEVKKGEDGSFVYVYAVDPGRQYVLRGIQFEGAKVFTEAELRDILGAGSVWQTARPLNYDELQAGLNALRARYQQAGYWDAIVRDPGLGQRDRETGTVRLTIQVEEGKSRHLRQFHTSGNAAMTAEAIREMLKVGDGDPLDRAKLVDFQQALRSAYVAKGYLYVDVQIDLKAALGYRRIDVDVTVNIAEGGRVRIGDITVIGLVRTQEKVVRRELLFQRGDWYDPDRVAQSRQALTRLGLFRSVQIGPADRSEISGRERELDIVVDVREGKAGNVSFGPGWSLVKGWNYAAEASYNNIGGAGRQASVRGAISEERDQYAIGPRTLLGRKIGTGYVEPYLFDLPVDASLTANQNAEWGGQLWNLTYGGEIALIHKLRLLLPGSSVSTFYGQKIAKTEGSNQRVEEQVATDVRIGSVGVRFNLDLRNNLKFPTSGYTLGSELAWARYDLGGDLRYFRWHFDTSYYIGLTDNTVLALGLDMTAYEDVQRKGGLLGILPPSERLAAGGADTVRGFPAGSLGPVVRGPTFADDLANHNCKVTYSTSPLNGSMRSTLKTEIRHRINDLFAMTGFIDNGNSLLSRDQARKFAEAYAPIAAPTSDPDCAGVAGIRRVEDNFPYTYDEAIRNPRLIWLRHYWSYGLAANVLTALGAVNFGYGLPWREPESPTCAEQSSNCNIRRRQTQPWWRAGEFYLNVGARF